MSEQAPSVGRIVHYGNDGTCSAAMITEVYPNGVGGVIDAVTLTVFLPRGTLYQAGVPYAAGDVAWTWHYPEDCL